MKKLVALFLAVAMIVCCFAGCGSSSEGEGEEGTYRVAMITDYGDITDQSFNQITYEACKAFCEENAIDFTYFKPAGDTTADRVAMIDKAVDEGYNVIVMPGYTFGGTIVEVSEVYSDIKFVALDVGAGDILDAGVPAAGETYDYTPENWNVTDYYYEDNVYCAIYKEELCGYMAGYAAVKMGYTKLGFLGGMAVASVLRYGHGYIQGADAAAAELGIQIDMKFAFGNQFYGDADIKAAMDTWYQSGTEVIFPCGGAIYVSPAEAAAAAGGKIIGVDTDQAAVIDGTYGEGLTVTSAMKGLYATTYDTLSEIILNDNWANYAGKIESLGLVSGEDVEANYVQIPYESTQWCDAFTQEDYMALVAAMYDGTIKVSDDITETPATTNTNLEYLGNIKTANCCFPTGVVVSDTEPTFKQDLLVYEGRYFQIGIGHKEYAAEKIMDEDYYVLTLAAIARELAREQITSAAVFIAAGLPLSWVGSQKQAFKEYLLRNSEVDFSFRDREYHIKIVGAEVFPQGFAAIAERLSEFSGTHLLCDIGNGTMNLLRIANKKPDPRNMFTEKYRVQQCVIAMQEALMREHKAQVDEEIIYSFLRHGTTGITAEIEQTMTAAAKDYVQEIFRKLREHGYDPRLMKLYVVGGGGCLIRNFCQYDRNRIVINDDICATAKGYEYMAAMNFRKAGK